MTIQKGHPMTDLTALADRVEKLTGPDRGIDAEICAVIEPSLVVYHGAQSVPYLHGIAGNSYKDIGEACPKVPAYTASLDVAMTLVPPEWLLETLSEVAGEGLCFACFVDPFLNLEAQAVATTTAIALTAAALRAHAAQSVPVEVVDLQKAYDDWRNEESEAIDLIEATGRFLAKLRDAGE